MTDALALVAAAGWAVVLFLLLAIRALDRELKAARDRAAWAEELLARRRRG